MIYIQTSAKTSQNVEKSFRTVAEIIVDRIEKGIIDPEHEGGIKVGSAKLMNISLNKNGVSQSSNNQNNNNERCC